LPLPDLSSQLQNALAARADLLDEKHQSALRLFNGFLEGHPDLVIDLYARTLLIHNYANSPAAGASALRAAQTFYLQQLPWLKSILVKVRNGTDDERRGVLVYGARPDLRIREHGVAYAIHLDLNRDASFYMDTRHLRQWALENLRDQRVLNTFAYTGSLGVAAMAGGAQQVIQLDRNRAFLNIAKESYSLNGFPISRAHFLAEDFFPALAKLKKSGIRFDGVFLDPPFFSSTRSGRVDLENDHTRLINKIRPLVRDGGWIVSINNALFVSGEDYMSELNALCADGFLEVEQLIPVPVDFTGTPETVKSTPPADPAPFIHSTKIALLRVKHNNT
jgi:23S rRNA (cytosine1962-C5)-methyltransferase